MDESSLCCWTTEFVTERERDNFPWKEPGNENARLRLAKCGNFGDLVDGKEIGQEGFICDFDANISLLSFFFGKREINFRKGKELTTLRSMDKMFRRKLGSRTSAEEGV